MLTFAQYVEKRTGEKMPEGEIPGSWFATHGYPMIVRCAVCDMTMVIASAMIPSAYIDDDGYVYCSDCAGVEE